MYRGTCPSSLSVNDQNAHTTNYEDLKLRVLSSAALKLGKLFCALNLSTTKLENKTQFTYNNSRLCVTNRDFRTSLRPALALKSGT